MIIENRSDIYYRVKESLNSECKYKESSKKEYFLELILNRIEKIDIFYIESWKAKNSIKLLDGNIAIIVWDINFWKYYEEYLIQVDICKSYNKNITQGVISFMFSFLSKKYDDIYELSSFFKQINTEYSIHGQLKRESHKYINDIVFLSKIFALYHEIGHFKQMENNNEIIPYKNLVLDLFDPIKDSHLSYLKEWEYLVKETVSDIVTGKKNGKYILEEIIADLYAIVQTIKFYQEIFKEEKFQIIVNCLQSYEYISGFQHMFSTISSAWENHNFEIKFGLPLKQHSHDNYVNQLAISRNEIGGHIILFLLKTIYHLNEVDMTKILDDLDKCYVNQTDIINCLANEQFICTAIQEALNMKY